MTTIATATLDTPAGAFCVAVRDDKIVAAAFVDHFDRVARKVERRFGRDKWSTSSDPAGVETIMESYVGGALDALDDLAVDLGGTAFQQRVWTALRSIPTGSTWSYGDLASAIGSPGAVRAVGTANGANPVWIVVPCHRVIRTDGTLGGYGGGLDRKEWLLTHERAWPAA